MKKLLIVFLIASPVVLVAQLAKPDGTVASITPVLQIGDSNDPDQWFDYSKGLNLIAYRTTHNRNDIGGFLNDYISLTLDADMVLPPTISNFEYAVNGTDDLTYGTVGKNTTVDINGSVGVTDANGQIRAVDGITNWNGSGTNVGSIIGLYGASQTYDGVIRSVRGVTGWVGIYGGTVNGEAAAFYAIAPSLGGTISGHNVAYFNENWGAGAFSWYSEGGTLHAETGHANNVGLEVIAAASQAVDLQRWLASDESTVLAKIDKDGKLTAADIIIGSTSIKPLRATSASLGGSALLAGACATNTTTVTGATTSMAVDVSPVTYPGDGIIWDGYVSASNTVTTRVCAILALTPTASTYNIAVIQ